MNLPHVGASSPQVLDFIDPAGREILTDPSRPVLADEKIVNCVYKQILFTIVMVLFQRDMLKLKATGASIIKLFIVIKRDGRLRLVLDYRGTNRFALA